MLEQTGTRSRKVLRSKMAEVFSDEIKALPVEMRYILLDDLVTAFENRLSIFSQAKSSLPSMEFELAARNEQVIA